MGNLIRRFLQWAKEREDNVEKYAKYWRDKGKPVDVKKMYFELNACGCYYTELIIRTEQHIDRYIQLQKEGKSALEIANILVKEIDGNKS